MFKLQFLSDIHLEFLKKENIPKLTPVAPYLALLGDIGNPFQENYKLFIDTVSKQFEHVFVISGNHEYYQLDEDFQNMENIDKQIEQITKEYKNVHYLNNKIYELGNIIILGSTLWTHTPDYMKKKVTLSMNDYRYIFQDDELITTDMTNKWNDEAVIWLMEQIKKFADKDIIILTHHGPSYEMLNPIYEGDTLNCAFANKLDKMIQPPIKAWLSGHTHGCVDKKINSVMCMSNCLGYEDEFVKGFDPEKCVEI